MKTFDRKIAINSHLSLVSFLKSISSIHQIVAKKVTCNTSLKEAHVTTGIKDQVIQVVATSFFDFIFQTFKNERNENDKNKNN
jgi:hypothetical protein